MSSKYLAFRG
jgi:hypothetical protein